MTYCWENTYCLKWNLFIKKTKAREVVLPNSESVPIIQYYVILNSSHKWECPAHLARERWRGWQMWLIFIYHHDLIWWREFSLFRFQRSLTSIHLGIEQFIQMILLFLKLFISLYRVGCFIRFLNTVVVVFLFFSKKYLRLFLLIKLHFFHVSWVINQWLTSKVVYIPASY